MAGVLSAHSPKFNSKLVDLVALKVLPEPLSLGRNHKPVPHAVLVEALHAEATLRGYAVKREQLALGKKGAALFGVMDLTPDADGVYAVNPAALAVRPTVPAISVTGERGMSFGFRNATDCSMGIYGVAGERVFVCDNLALSGSLFALKRKNTTGLDLHDAVARGFDKFLLHIAVLDVEITRLSDTRLTDIEAKTMAYDVFAAGVVPVRLFDDVERFYFHPAEDMTDCTPRTAFGLHNAFTRAIKDLTPTRMFGASVALGKHFGIQS